MNRFEIIKDIDEGAFGFVQMAKNKETGEIVAIKKIKKKYNSWDECMNLREIRSLKKLKHPNVIRLKEVFKLEQELFLVFEFARTNLFKLYNDEYKENGLAMPEHLIKSLIFQAVSALVYIHKMGFFHRDMKPENLLINERQVLKIADFGLAREIRSSPPYTEYVSTRWYRSPEILLKSTNYNSPVDIWALGCIMAELYMNAPLFNGASEMDQLSKIAAVMGHPGKTWPEGLKLASQTGFVFPHNPPQNLEDIIKSASPMAIDMIKSMLNYDSSKRPTAAKLLQHPYFAQQHSNSFTELPPTIPFTTHVPLPTKGSEIESKPHGPLSQLNPLNMINQPPLVHSHAQHSFSLGAHHMPKNQFGGRNHMSDLENNWREESLSGSKGVRKSNNSPRQRIPSSLLTETQPKTTTFNMEIDFDENQFQKKLDSVFPAHAKQQSGSSNPQLYVPRPRKSEIEELSSKTNFTAKKKHIDVELEELEKQILATKKKYSSPVNSRQNLEKAAQQLEESAISRKKGIFYNQNNHENIRKTEPIGTSIFNDQLEELLNREQRLLEQKSVKGIDLKLPDHNFSKKNINRPKNLIYDHPINLDGPFSSEASMFKVGETHRTYEGGSLAEVEPAPARFKINGFQTSKTVTENTKVPAILGSQF